ncbi:MAG TPA: hypothetical protein VH247_10240 [Thermoleophilaceae bacterium]|jgi:hypothetical protein|nr:hypothetical protein [Thermoleophilaceae bacterium]
MSTVAPPLALGTAGIIVIVAVVLLLGAGAYALLWRNDPREAQIEAERERVSEEFPLGEPVDFQSELKPPSDPAA